MQGEPGRGKTTVLRTVLRGIAAHYPAPGAVVLDYDRLVPVVERIRATLRRRLTDRGVWHGPELFLVIDDYDKVPADPLEPLAELLRHGSSIGVHLLAAATTGFGDRPPIRDLPAKDRTEIRLSRAPDRRQDTVDSRWVPQFRWDTWENPTPVGRAYVDGEHRGYVQVAIDTEMRPPEFRPLDEFLALGPEPPDRRPSPVRAESLTAVIGVTDDGDPVELNVRLHTWCGGDVGAGKSTFLRRVAVSLATRYPPTAVQLLLADGNPPRLDDLATLPNTAAYLSLAEPKDWHRLAALLDDEVRRRLELKEQGVLPALPDLVALVDNTGVFDELRKIVAAQPKEFGLVPTGS